MESLITPVRLGFFLGMPGIRSGLNPSLPYRGIDRNWFLAWEDDKISFEQSGRVELLRLGDEYWDANDSDELRWDRCLATRIRDEFQREQFVLDLIYAEIVAFPEFEATPEECADWWSHLAEGVERLCFVHERIAQRPSGMKFLGFDISRPIRSFHSSLIQPMLKTDEFAADLNENGLFDDLDRCRDCLRATNAIGYGTMPSVVISIWSVD